MWPHRGTVARDWRGRGASQMGQEALVLCQREGVVAGSHHHGGCSYCPLTLMRQHATALCRRRRCPTAGRESPSTQPAPPLRAPPPPAAPSGSRAAGAADRWRSALPTGTGRAEHEERKCPPGRSGVVRVGKRRLQTWPQDEGRMARHRARVSARLCVPPCRQSRRPAARRAPSGRGPSGSRRLCAPSPSPSPPTYTRPPLTYMPLPAYMAITSSP